MFIFLEKDGFEANSKSSGDKMIMSQKNDGAPIRRPYRGIQIKDDTYAVLSVRKPTGEAIPLTSSSCTQGYSLRYGSPNVVGQVSEYADFILQQVQDQRMEKQQIIETFGESFVYFFGERPRIVTFSGQLMNTEDFNWRAQFWYNYEHYLRGSRLVQQNARCYLAYDTVVIEGYPLSATAVDDADNPYQISFQMTLLMTDYHEYSLIGSKYFPGEGVNNDSIVDTLNIALDDEQQKFVSTGVEVRRANMNATLSSQIPQEGFLALMRKGMKAVNDVMDGTLLAGFMKGISGLLGGRSMRVPVGVASYLTLTSEAQLGSAGGISTTNVVSSAQREFDIKTGRYLGSTFIGGVPVPGTKLQIMGPSRFAPSWISDVTGTSRGMIFENYDEYPKRSQELSLLDLIGPDAAAVVETKAAARVAKMTAEQQQLSLANVIAASGSWLNTLTEVVSAIREGFGMVQTVLNAVRDPLGAVGRALGMTPQDMARFGEGFKKGDMIPGVSGYLGSKALKRWEDLATSLPARYSDLGAAFRGQEYQSGDAEKLEDIGYEMAYGTSNYEPLINRLKASESESAATEATQELDDAYGDTDSVYGESRDDPATLDEVYGQGGTIQKTQPTAEEKANMVVAVYGDTPVNDTDVSGITPDDADSAPIEPFV